MNPRGMRGIFIVLCLLLVAVIPQLSHAAAMHYFDCKECHLSGSTGTKLTLSQLETNNVCLKCHKVGATFSIAVPAGDGVMHGRFLGDYASNAMGNGIPGATVQTSHNWAAKDAQPAAGAKAPTKVLANAGFYSTYGSSSGYVTCSRCHNPHGDTTNTKLLIRDASLSNAPMDPDKMCLACHSDWNLSTANHGMLSHPLVANYNTTYASNPKFKVPMAPAGELRLEKGGVSCSSCHGLHYVDSTSGTADGWASYDAGSLGNGDGKLLRADGRKITFTNGDIVNPETMDAATLAAWQAQAETRSALCTSCHVYAEHGGHQLLGCLDCHSGHSYVPGADPNYYVLRGSINTSLTPPNSVSNPLVVQNVARLIYNSQNSKWLSSDPARPGYCQSCHTTLTAGSSHNGFQDGGVAQCATCHSHGGETGSFSGACNSCHGFPPSDNVAQSPGYAYTSTYRYNSVIGYFDESKTPHVSHAGYNSASGSANYGFSCEQCHKGNAHNAGNFSEVFIDKAGIIASTGTMNPTYNAAVTVTRTGTCATMYCHSNGRTLGGSPTAVNVYWKNGDNTIMASGTRCQACHGNNATTMASKGNTQAHQAHLGAGSHTYNAAITALNCAVCHEVTATSSAALANGANAKGGPHVDGTATVDFSAVAASGSYTKPNCTTVYCHSNGAGTNGNVYNSASWSDAPSGSCTYCHGNVDLTSGSHAAHLNDSDNEIGRNLGCVDCHSVTVSGNTTISNRSHHLDGADGHIDIGVKMQNGSTKTGTSCSDISCHSNGNFDGTVTYANPVWGTNRGCDGCHGTSGTVYPDYANAGAGSINANSHRPHYNSAIACGECHSQTSTAGVSINGTKPAVHVNFLVNVALLQGNWTNGTKTCSSTYCHGVGTPQWGDAGSASCGSCHKANNELANAHSGHYNVASNGAFTEVNSSTAGEYIIQCGVCHSTNNGVQHAKGAANANYTAQVAFDGTVASGTYLPGSTYLNDPQGYSYSAATCSNLYCHGDFGGNGNPTNTPKWNSVTSGDCGTCHDVDTSVSMSGGSHDAHVKTSLALGCDVCHDGTAVKATTGITSKALHVNRFLNMNLKDSDPRVGASAKYNSTNIGGSAVNQGTIAQANVGAGPYGNCSNVYCHSTVQGSPDPTTAATYKNPIWGDNIGICNGCHKADSTGVNTQDTGSHFKHVSSTEYNKGCSVCHQGATGPGSANHVNYAINVDINNTFGASAAYNGATAMAKVPGKAYSSCSNVYCHSDGYTTSLTYNTVTWGNASDAACGSCHGATDSKVPTSPPHAKHVGSAAGQYKYACVVCHQTVASATADSSVQPTVISKSLHVNQLRDVDFNGFAYNSATWSSSQCANTYCHSNGTSLTPSHTGISWSGSKDCAACHGDGSTLASNAHDMHLAAQNGARVGRNIQCNECHTATASNNTSISSTANHVNKLVNIQFSTSIILNGDAPKYNGATTVGGLTQLPGSAIGSCENVYCHSNGNLASNSGTGALVNTSSLKMVAWNSTGLDCADCHGDGTKAYPTYANTGAGTNKANSHEAHVGNSGFSCAVCHETTTSSASTDPAVMTLISNGTHLNRVENVQNAAVFASYDFTSKTCSTVTCHGGNDAVWGGAVSCRDCHVSTVADVDNFKKDGIAAQIKSSEYTSFGHGQATYNGVSLITLANGGNDCLWCHDSSADHDITSATNPFRLKGLTYNSGAFGANGACLVCHDSDETNTAYKAEASFTGLNLNNVPKIDKWHQMNAHTYNDDGGMFCFDCHDPHGDNSNIMMIQANAVMNSTTLGVPEVISTGLYNVTGLNAARTAVVNAIVFTDNTKPVGAGGFAINTATLGFDTGVCNACHTASASNPKMQHYTRTSSDSHNATALCTNCHKHSDNTINNGEAFKGSGCNGCHGGNYKGVPSSKNFWPDDGNANAENDAGRHLTHVNVISQKLWSYNASVLLQQVDTDSKQIQVCAYCHTNPGSDGDHSVTLPAEVNTMKKLWNAATDNGVWSASGDSNNGTCATVDCHNNQTTPAGFSWYGATAGTCTMCHTAGGTDDLANNNIHPNSGLHSPSSVGVTNHGATMGCTQCHNSTKPSTHIDGSAEADSNSNSDRFLRVGNTLAEAFLFAEGTPDSLTAAPTCSGTGAIISGCHSDGGNWKRQWSTEADSTATTYGSNRCVTCHGVANNWRDGLTVKHNVAGLNTTSNHAICETCHVAPNAPYLFGTHHEDSPTKLVEYNNNVNVNYNASTATCTNMCHGTGKRMQNAAGGPSTGSTVFGTLGLAGQGPSCTSCHSDLAGLATSPGTRAGYTFVGGGQHAVHVNTAALSYTAAATNNSQPTYYDYSCANCHTNTASAHLNGVLNVTVTGFNTSDNTCGTANVCHQNGQGGNPVKSADWDSGWVSDSDGDTCNNCHGNFPTTGAHVVHNTVGIHTADIYSGTTGKLDTDVADPDNSHGDPATSSTINCNTCHKDTVSMSRNRLGDACSSCHSGNAASTTMTIANKSKHVDGSRQVVYNMTGFKSKAQLRDDITTLSTVNASWTRTNGYKSQTAPYSYDLSKNSSPGWNSTAKTCSTVDCHNGITTPAWNSGSNGNCMACHTELPK